MQMKGVPGDLILKWVGHVNLKITGGYTHFDEAFRKKTIERVSAGSIKEDGPLDPT